MCSLKCRMLAVMMRDTAAAVYVPLPPHSRFPHLPPFAATHPTHVPPAFWAPLPRTHVPPRSDGPPPPTRFPCARTPPTACPRPTLTYGDTPRPAPSSPQHVPSSTGPSAQPGPSLTRLGAPQSVAALLQSFLHSPFSPYPEMPTTPAGTAMLASMAAGGPRRHWPQPDCVPW